MGALEGRDDWRGIHIRIKEACLDDAVQLLKARGYPPIESRNDGRGAVMLRFAGIGDDLCYAIVGALPLDYFDIRGTAA